MRERNGGSLNLQNRLIVLRGEREVDPAPQGPQTSHLLFCYSFLSPSIAAMSIVVSDPVTNTPLAERGDWTVTPIDLRDASRIIDYVKADPYCREALATRRRHRFDLRKWKIVMGQSASDVAAAADAEDEDGDDEKGGGGPQPKVEVDYQKDPRFRAAIVRLLGDEGLRMEMLFPIIVFRIRIDRGQWALDEMERAHPGDDYLLPIQVQELDETTGRLDYCFNKRTGYPYYRYLPRDETLLNDWRYVVYRVPGKSAEFAPEAVGRSQAISAMIPGPPPPSSSFSGGSSLASSYHDRFRMRMLGEARAISGPVEVGYDDGRQGGDDYGGEGQGGGADDEGTERGPLSRLRSPFRSLSWRAAEVSLAWQNRKNVESQTATSQRLLITRPFKEVPPSSFIFSSGVIGSEDHLLVSRQSIESDSKEPGSRCFLKSGSIDIFGDKRSLERCDTQPDDNVF
jgi:hypothetical protein